MSFKSGGGFYPSENFPASISNAQTSFENSNKGFTRPELLYQIPSYLNTQSDMRMTRSQIIDPLGSYLPSASRRPQYGQNESIPIDLNNQKKIPQEISQPPSFISSSLSQPQPAGINSGISFPMASPPISFQESKLASAGQPYGLNFSYEAPKQINYSEKTDDKLYSYLTKSTNTNINYEQPKKTIGTGSDTLSGTNHLLTSNLTNLSSNTFNKSYDSSRDGSLKNYDAFSIVNKLDSSYGLGTTEDNFRFKDRLGDPLSKPNALGLNDTLYLKTAQAYPPSNFNFSTNPSPAFSTSNPAPVKEFFLKSPREGPGLATIKEFDLPPKLDDKIFPEITNRKSGTMYQSDFLMRTSPINYTTSSNNYSKTKNSIDPFISSDKPFNKIPDISGTQNLLQSFNQTDNLYQTSVPDKSFQYTREFFDLKTVPTTQIVDSRNDRIEQNYQPRRESGKEIKDFIPTSFDTNINNKKFKTSTRQSYDRPIGLPDNEVFNKTTFQPDFKTKQNNDFFSPAPNMFMEKDDRTAIRHYEIVNPQGKPPLEFGRSLGTTDPFKPIFSDPLREANPLSMGLKANELSSTTKRANDQYTETLKKAPLKSGLDFTPPLTNTFEDLNIQTHVLINGEPVEISEDNIFGNDFIKTSKFVSKNPSFHAPDKVGEIFPKKTDVSSKPLFSDDLYQKYKGPDTASWQESFKKTEYSIPGTRGQTETKPPEFITKDISKDNTNETSFRKDLSNSINTFTSFQYPDLNKQKLQTSPNLANYRQFPSRDISFEEQYRPESSGFTRIAFDQPSTTAIPDSRELTRNSRSDSSSKIIADLFRSLTLKMEDFEMGPSIGRGNFGNIYLARHIKSRFFVALKIISKRILKETETEATLAKEIKLQSQLNHPNIIQLYSFFHDENRIVLVMEYATHGELYKELKDQNIKMFSEEKAAPYVRQVAEAINYMHKKGIIHRDIKPENILNTFGVLKLSDFGWASTGTNPRTSFCGTLEYVSPEVVENKEYSYSVDVWGLGVLCFELCSGKTPFEGTDSTSDTYLRIMDLKIEYPAHFSSELRDFLGKIFVKDQSKRINIYQALNHPWIVNKAGKIETTDQNIYRKMKELL